MYEPHKKLWRKTHGAIKKVHVCWKHLYHRKQIYCTANTPVIQYQQSPLQVICINSVYTCRILLYSMTAHCAIITSRSISLFFKKAPKLNVGYIGIMQGDLGTINLALSTSCCIPMQTSNSSLSCHILLIQVHWSLY